MFFLAFLFMEYFKDDDKEEDESLFEVSVSDPEDEVKLARSPLKLKVVKTDKKLLENQNL